MRFRIKDLLPPPRVRLVVLAETADIAKNLEFRTDTAKTIINNLITDREKVDITYYSGPRWTEPDAVRKILTKRAILAVVYSEKLDREPGNPNAGKYTAWFTAQFPRKLTARLRRELRGKKDTTAWAVAKDLMLRTPEGVEVRELRRGVR